MGSRSHPSSRRLRANQQAGRRFELKCLKAFDVVGIKAEDVNELNGFAHGADIWLPELRAVVQCKATKTRKSLRQGLFEAQEHNPTASTWICIHSWRADGKPTKIRAILSDRGDGRTYHFDMKGLLVFLNERLQLLEGLAKSRDAR